MTRRLLASASLLALLSSVACSSSSSSVGTGNDSGIGSGNDSSTTDDGGVTTDDGGSTGDTGGNTGDTGTVNPGDGSTPLACPPATDAGTFAPATYAPVAKGTNQCASTDISAFITACINPGTTCNAWFAANVAGAAVDGGAGTTCGNCMAPTSGGAFTNTGALWFDPNGFFDANYAGCIQLTDATNGTACAKAFNDLNACDGTYCDQCEPPNDPNGQTDVPACNAAAEKGSCSTYASGFNTSCAPDLAADGGAAVSCFPGTGSTQTETNFTYVINLICGTGM